MASPKTRAKQLTIIARSNTGLLQEVLPVRCSCPTNTLTCVVQLIHMESTTHLKFALNGNGDTSGHQKWKDAIWKVHHFYKLYMQETDTLPFPEWEGQTELNWNQVVTTIREHAYGHNQMEIQVQAATAQLTS